jgi:pectin methylesterase-like acyl-CoA thioesterase
MMRIAVIATIVSSALAASGLAVGNVTLTVRSDGTGQFTSVQAALDSLQPGSNPTLGHVTLQLEGLFREVVTVYANFTQGVTFQASAPAVATVVVFTLHPPPPPHIHPFTSAVRAQGTGASPGDALIVYDLAGVNVTTWGSPTVSVDADDWTAVNVAIANDAGGYDKKTAGQSVALAVNGDRATLIGAALWGGQDTLMTGPNRVYAVDTAINGSCDSIFGYGSAVFEACNITIFDTVTAHK